jgi:hypothetical protein
MEVRHIPEPKRKAWSGSSPRPSFLRACHQIVPPDPIAQARSAASDQENLTDEMEAQRRQESVGRKERLPGDESADRRAAKRTCGRRRLEPHSRFVRSGLRRADEHARHSLADVRAVMPLTASAQRLAGVVGVIAVAQIGRRGAGLGAAMRVVPAAAQHRVQRQQRRRQIRENIIHAHKCTHLAGDRQRCWRLSASRFPSRATVAARRSRMASTYAILT